MEAPPRKRGRPPKHPKVASNDSPKSRANSAFNSVKSPSASSPADVEMVDRGVATVDSKSVQRGRKKSAGDKVEGAASVKPSGGGGSPSDRELSKSEADDVELLPEKLSSRRNKKQSLVH